MKSCVYEGEVHHTRYGPQRHAFRVPLFLVYLDLDEVESICEETVGWSSRRFAPTRFRRADYLGPADRSLADAVRDRVEGAHGVRPQGPIRLLTQLRYWGVVFNPVSFYYCFDAAGESVEWIVAEVTNIPWRERHAYVVPFGDGTMRLDKAFYVSPYLPMDLEYHWRFDPPGESLRVGMGCRRGEERVFDASLGMRRRPLRGATRAGVWWRHPWMGVRTLASIYWHALRLRRKGARAYPRPDSRPDARPRAHTVGA